MASSSPVHLMDLLDDAENLQGDNQELRDRILNPAAKQFHRTDLQRPRCRQCTRTRQRDFRSN